MWHDLTVPFIPDVTILNMTSELLDMVKPLLADKDSPTFETNFAESLLVRAFKMALQRGNVRELLL